MKDIPIFFVAFEEQDNLGIGYITSVLIQSGFTVKIIDFRLAKEAILKQFQQYKPLIVGFSIIFQYNIDDFKNLITYLRNNGVNSHFTAGGHYPSLRYDELMEIIPELDSVVLFEGEYSFLELANCIYAGKNWKSNKGIAYRENGRKTANSLCPVENDLDNYPIPVRQPLKEFALGKKYATILAGRGCYYNCTFCSIREFYSRAGGSIKRIRQPEKVVREMELLHEQSDCSVFVFQDDDFPVSSKKGRDWVTEFCNLLAEKGLSDKIMWKISCRPDEVDTETFTFMKAHGLFLVYLGIESGTDESLRMMNKHTNTEKNIKAVEILKDLGIAYDYGFMLFDPVTTYQLLLDNLVFLEKIIGDGSSPITFCKMLPYAETKIEHTLKEQGRIKGTPGYLDYDFTDKTINQMFDFMIDCFSDWIAEHDGLLNTARWTRFYLTTYNNFYPSSDAFSKLERTTNKVIAESNIFFIDTIKYLIQVFSSQTNNADILNNIKENVSVKHSAYRANLRKIIDGIEKLAFLSPEHRK